MNEKTGLARRSRTPSATIGKQKEREYGQYWPRRRGRKEGWEAPGAFKGHFGRSRRPQDLQKGSRRLTGDHLGGGSDDVATVAHGPDHGVHEPQHAEHEGGRRVGAVEVGAEVRRGLAGRNSEDPEDPEHLSSIDGVRRSRPERDARSLRLAEAGIGDVVQGSRDVQQRSQT